MVEKTTKMDFDEGESFFIMCAIKDFVKNNPQYQGSNKLKEEVIDHIEEIEQEIKHSLTTIRISLSFTTNINKIFFNLSR